MLLVIILRKESKCNICLSKIRFYQTYMKDNNGVYHKSCLLSHIMMTYLCEHRITTEEQN